MTVFEFIAAHPWWTLALVAVSGWAVGEAASAPVAAWRKWKRPGDCPRCHGTGREP